MGQILTILLIVVSTSARQAPELVPQVSLGPFSIQPPVVFGSRGAWLATSNGNGLIKIFDITSGRVARQLDVKLQVNVLKAHPSKDILGILSGWHFLVLYDIQAGREIWQTATGLDCNAISFSQDGTKLLGLCPEKIASSRRPPKSKVTIKTWDVQTGAEIQTSSVPIPDGIIDLETISEDGRWAGGVGGILDLNSGTKVGTAKGMVWVLSISAKTHTAITIGGNGVVALTDAVTGKQLSDHLGAISAVTSTDGMKFLLSGLNGITIVDAATGQIKRINADDLPYMPGMAFGPDNDQIALAESRAVLLLRVSNPTERRILGDPSAPVVSSRLMRSLIAVRDASIAELTPQMSKFGAGPWIPPIPAFLDSGRILALRSADGWWEVWDVATGNRLPFREPVGDLKRYEKSGSHIEVLLNEQDLQEIEANLGSPSYNTKQTAVTPIALKGFSACSSMNGDHVLDVSRTDKAVTSAVLRSVNGETIDLLADGVDLSAFRFRSKRQSLIQHDDPPSLCSLSPDGTRLIVEGLRSDLRTTQPKKLHRMFAANSEDLHGKQTSDSLIVYATNTGRKVCELENSIPGVAFDVVARDLIFSADGKKIIAGGDREKTVGFGIEHRNIRVWDANSCKQLLTIKANASSVLGFSSDGLQFFTALTRQPETQNYGVRVWDSLSGKPLFDITDVAANNKLLTITPKGNVLIGPNRENSLGIWDRWTGEKLGTMRPFQEGEWLVTTPSGLFDGSPRGWTEITWRDSKESVTSQPAEVFFNEFYRPGLFAELLHGHKPEAPRSIAQVDRRQPRVSITADSDTTAQRAVTIHISVEEIAASPGEKNSSGVRDVRLFRNGTLVKAWHGDLALRDGKASLAATIAVVAGENRFVAYAFNHDNVKSTDAVAVVKNTATPLLSTAYVLAIGVNQYANPKFNLAFAVPDARRLAEMLAQTQQELGKYTHVVKVNLLDDEATKQNILFALSRLGGRNQGSPLSDIPPQLMTLQAVEPDDTVILYFAGHGVASNDHFYLVPHDLGYSGSRNSLRESLKQVLQSSISDSELEQAFESIDAAHSLLIIDACSSGKALDSEEQRRGPMNSKGLAQLAYEKGMYVLTASQAYQAALESSRLGHGYLTYALAEEGLRTKLADTKPIDGEVTVLEWFEYAARRVPQLQMEAMQQASLQGRLLTFEIEPPPGSISPDDRTEGGGLQTPRFYYRRDLSGLDAIVAKVH